MTVPCLQSIGSSSVILPEQISTARHKIFVRRTGSRAYPRSKEVMCERPRTSESARKSPTSPVRMMDRLERSPIATTIASIVSARGRPAAKRNEPADRAMDSVTGTIVRSNSRRNWFTVLSRGVPVVDSAITTVGMAISAPSSIARRRYWKTLPRRSEIAERAPESKTTRSLPTVDFQSAVRHPTSDDRVPMHRGARSREDASASA